MAEIAGSCLSHTGDQCDLHTVGLEADLWLETRGWNGQLWPWTDANTVWDLLLLWTERTRGWMKHRRLPCQELSQPTTGRVWHPIVEEVWGLQDCDLHSRTAYGTRDGVGGRLDKPLGDEREGVGGLSLSQNKPAKRRKKIKAYQCKESSILNQQTNPSNNSK